MRDEHKRREWFGAPSAQSIRSRLDGERSRMSSQEQLDQRKRLAEKYGTDSPKEAWERYIEDAIKESDEKHGVGDHEKIKAQSGV